MHYCIVSIYLLNRSIGDDVHNNFTSFQSCLTLPVSYQCIGLVVWGSLNQLITIPSRGGRCMCKARDPLPPPSNTEPRHSRLHLISCPPQCSHIWHQATQHICMLLSEFTPGLYTEIGVPVEARPEHLDQPTTTECLGRAVNTTAANHHLPHLSMRCLGCHRDPGVVWAEQRVSEARVRTDERLHVNARPSTTHQQSSVPYARCLSQSSVVNCCQACGWEQLPSAPHNNQPHVCCRGGISDVRSPRPKKQGSAT